MTENVKVALRAWKWVVASAADLVGMWAGARVVPLVGEGC